MKIKGGNKNNGAVELKKKQTHAESLCFCSTVMFVFGGSLSWYGYEKPVYGLHIYRLLRVHIIPRIFVSRQETFCHLLGIVPDSPRWDENLPNFIEAAQNQMWPRTKETKPRCVQKRLKGKRCVCVCV